MNGPTIPRSNKIGRMKMSNRKDDLLCAILTLFLLLIAGVIIYSRGENDVRNRYGNTSKH